MSITLTALATIGWYAGNIVGTAQRDRIVTQEDADRIAEALRQSLTFNVLVDNGHTVEEIIDILGLRHARGEEFEKITGVPWPL